MSAWERLKKWWRELDPEYSPDRARFQHMRQMKKLSQMCERAAREERTRPIPYLTREIKRHAREYAKRYPSRIT